MKNRLLECISLNDIHFSIKVKVILILFIQTAFHSFQLLSDSLFLNTFHAENLQGKCFLAQSYAIMPHSET